METRTGCPLLRYLPEIMEISKRLRHSGEMEAFVSVAKNLCGVCRAKTETGECPLGETFGRVLWLSLPRMMQGSEGDEVELERKG